MPKPAALLCNGVQPRIVHSNQFVPVPFNYSLKKIILLASNELIRLSIETSVRDRHAHAHCSLYSLVDHHTRSHYKQQHCGESECVICVCLQSTWEFMDYKGFQWNRYVHQFKYTNTYFVYTEMKTNRKKRIFFLLLFTRDRSRPLLILHSWNHMTSYENHWNNNRQAGSNVSNEMRFPHHARHHAYAHLRQDVACTLFRLVVARNSERGTLITLDLCNLDATKSRQTRFTSLDSCTFYARPDQKL